MAFDSQFESEAAKPPLSVHPAFPAIVALWFAALLGIGSLVLPAVLLDRLVSATGLASLIPAASPPLGMTARALIALAGALGGAALGVAIARRVAQGHRPQEESRAAKLAAGSRRPISVHDELGGEGVVNGEGLPISRRRALAISEDDRPSDFLYRAPLPGDDPDAPAPFAAAPFVDALPDDEPLELSDLAGEEQPAEADGTPEMTDTPEAPSAWPSHQHIPRGLEPLPFAAPSLARRAPPVEEACDEEPEAVPEFQLETVEAPVGTADEIRADWQTAPLEGLGLVQLVQRLGSTIERRRELRALAAAPPPATPASFAEADLEPAAAEEAVQAMAAFFGSAPEARSQADEDSRQAPAPAPRPDFLNPLSLADESDGDDAVPDFSLPLRRSVAAAPPFTPADNDAEEPDAEAELETGYSSLLGMSNPFAAPKSEFVRIEEPQEDLDLAEPAVVFPGQQEPANAFGSRPFDPPAKSAAPAPAHAQAPADADAALRAALATLQRMSGAA
jgi:hypothetical protein